MPTLEHENASERLAVGSASPFARVCKRGISRKKPHYLKIAESIRDSIRQRKLLPGEPLPSSRSLAKIMGVNRNTAIAALGELVAEGWITTKTKSLHRVSKELPSFYFKVGAAPASDAGRIKHEWRFVRSPTLPQIITVAPPQFDFSSGSPDPRLFPQKEFVSHIHDALRLGRRLIEYGDTEGHAPFLAELRTYLRRVRSLTDCEVMVTHGAQEAVFLISQLLLTQGAQVGVEALGYRPVLESFRAAGAELNPIRIDREGVDPNDLERLLRKKRIALLYLTPHHQYPTTAVMPVARRMQVYKLACEYGVPIIEDDYDNEFHYRSLPIAPLASNDVAGRVIYVSSFSKGFSAAVRLGFIAAPKPVIDRLCMLKQLVSRQNDPLVQDALARWMRLGGFERHLRRNRRACEERRDAMHNCLLAARAKRPDWHWNLPDGGTAFWVETAADTSLLAERARARGVFISPEAYFHPEGTAGTGMRLGFARHTPAEIEKGIDLLLSLA